MEVFICRQNIDHYRKLLDVAIGEMQRRKIMRLLAAEEAALKQLTLKKNSRRPKLKK